MPLNVYKKSFLERAWDIFGNIMMVIAALAIIGIAVLGGRLLFKLTDRTCIETSAFDTTDQIIGASGTYCSKWKQN